MHVHVDRVTMTSQTMHLEGAIQGGMYSATSYFHGLVQERRNSSALAMELRLSCINTSISYKLIGPCEMCK